MYFVHNNTSNKSLYQFTGRQHLRNLLTYRVPLFKLFDADEILKKQLNVK